MTSKPTESKQKRKYNLTEKGRQSLIKSRLGTKASEVTRLKMSNVKLGKKRFWSQEHKENHKRSISKGVEHYKWKGDEVGYSQLHLYVNKYRPKSFICEICKVKPSKYLANVTGIYNRNFKNWKNLCAKCHYEYDQQERRRDRISGKYTSQVMVEM